MSETDTARALFAPFGSGGDVPAPDAGARVLYLNAHDDPDVMALLSACAATVQQDFRPFARPLLARGVAVETEIPAEGAYDMALLRGRRQTDENRALLAAAVLALKPEGWLVAAGANDAGGKRLAKECAALGIAITEMSKHHCRIVYARITGFDRALAQSWVDAAAARSMDINGAPLWTQPGLFGWDRMDRGTALLLAHLPDDFRGGGADLGCGTGAIARHMLARNPRIDSVLCVDADARAVAMTRRNITDARADAQWLAVGGDDLPARALNWVVMNPPFHEGALTASSIGVTFIREAARILRPGGVLWLVANAHLPYEAHMAAAFTNITKVAESDGYKIYKAVK